MAQIGNIVVLVKAKVICSLSVWEILKMRLAGVTEKDIDKLVKIVIDYNNSETLNGESDDG